MRTFAFINVVNDKNRGISSVFWFFNYINNLLINLSSKRIKRAQIVKKN